MQNYIKPFVLAAGAALLTSCGSQLNIPEQPIQIQAQHPTKKSVLTDSQYETWWHMDLVQDTVPGMSVQRTYEEILPKKKGEKVIVGVIDSGVDNEHEDLKNVVWVNSDETPDNGEDDDNNGYVDDVHGWNFLGDIVGENMEYVRIIRRLGPKFEEKAENEISTSDLEEYEMYKKARAEYLEEKQEALNIKTQYQSILEQVTPAHAAIQEALDMETYTQEDLKTLEENRELQREVYIINQMFAFEDNMDNVIEELTEGIEYYSSRLDNHFNTDKDFRKAVGDDPYDITDTNYGNNEVSGPDPKKEDAKHGTHVSGIIAAERDNEIGMNGVANNVEILIARAVPDGDEYDKDIALAIRYAVDNGAKVINTSFGKFFSPNAEWVYDAIKYAAENDVLIVNAAGNDGIDLDEDGVQVYPNDQEGNTSEIADNFISVGALTYTYGEEMVAVFSNYGKSNVDVFAPGDKIWATTPNNEYEFLQGTSMASPAVAGVAAMLRSYFPELTAAQVKQILMESGLAINVNVQVGGDENNLKPFAEISKSGKIVNMYNAFILADKLTKN